MNVVALILAIVVIILFYILYRFFMMKSTELTKTASLLDSITPIDIKTSPTNTRYTYGIWIYVNGWDSNVNKVIFDRNDNVKLYFDKLSPVLKCDIAMTATETETVNITDSFPLQKWTHIIVNADNQYFDFYLDGKLVKSVRAHATNDTTVGSFPKIPIIDTKMNLGNPTGGFDAHITRFYHWNQPIDPHTAWKTYMAGNGQSTLTSVTNSYNVDLHVLKDNIEYTKFKLI